MPHLPNEVWLLIVSYLEPPDLWLSLRPVNRQLQQCAEQYFKREILPETTLNLPVVIPTYDVRTPFHGKVVFKAMPSNANANVRENFRLAIYCLKDAKPEYYRPHFLTRWKSMQHRETGSLDERKIRWELELGDERRPVCLHRSMAMNPGCRDGDARVAFDWTYTITSFYKA